jgi:phosphatidylglycerol:prolipoprotein diacylglycerol transferase
MNGIVINIDPVIFQIGGFEFRWYSLAVIAAAYAVLFLAVKGAVRRGIPAQVMYGMAPWVMVGAIFGARFFHVLDHLGYYSAHPELILQFQQGGLAIWGALIGGGIAMVIYSRLEKISLPVLLDVMVPALLIGQIIGRFGCIVNGDAAGSVTGLPWGFIYVHPNASIPAALAGVPTQPYPVYEMLWNGASLLVLLSLRKHFKRDGALFASYLVIYALGRLVLTTVRQETILFWGLQEAQVIALVAFTMAGAIFAWLYRRNHAPVREAKQGAKG